MGLSRKFSFTFFVVTLRHGDKIVPEDFWIRNYLIQKLCIPQNSLVDFLELCLVSQLTK